MLGSILTNLLFVFGMSCLIGGMRWQVQEIRVISGNVSVGMLYLATAGSLLPAALFLSGQLPSKALNDEVPTKEELVFCRINAAVMVVMYLCYLLFQLGTHKEEFDDNEQSTRNNHSARRNLWCQNYVFRGGYATPNFHIEVPTGAVDGIAPPRRLEKIHKSNSNFAANGANSEESLSSKSSLSDTDFETDNGTNNVQTIAPSPHSSQRRRRRQRKAAKRSGGVDALASSSMPEDDSRTYPLSNGAEIQLTRPEEGKRD